MLFSQGLGFILDEALVPPHTEVDTRVDIKCVCVCIYIRTHTFSLFNLLFASVLFYVFSQS